MHPWKKIIKGNTENVAKIACFICLERIQNSDDEIELKFHLFNFHSVKFHLKELVEISKEVEEREKSEGWSLDDILEEERDRREAEAREKAQSGGWMGIFGRKKVRPECLDKDAEVETAEVDCFLCQEKLIVRSCEYNNHLEKQHRVIFGVTDIMKAGASNEELDHENVEAEPEKTRTDADMVKELVRMKYLPEKRRMRLRTHTQRLFSRKYQVLTEEVFVNHCICISYVICYLLGHSYHTTLGQTAEMV